MTVLINQLPKLSLCICWFGLPMGSPLNSPHPLQPDSDMLGNKRVIMEEKYDFCHWWCKVGGLSFGSKLKDLLTNGYRCLWSRWLDLQVACSGSQSQSCLSCPSWWHVAMTIKYLVLQYICREQTVHILYRLPPKNRKRGKITYCIVCG